MSLYNLALAALGIFFAAYLLHTRQFSWALGVAKNSIVGIVGLLVCNFLFAGLAVGINIVTVLVVGVLGVPGFLLLYATQFLL
ncbi:MAG: pro-sigmaK processing inhibitor BofA family protein [Defluviitaleaceae bacterium]|nr:pro-sigmaK processing inhibitor BofA family protein [Defluviitaleaceae bacterium]